MSFQHLEGASYLCLNQSFARVVAGVSSMGTKGSLSLTIENATYFLEAGDSFVFRSELSHAFVNNGKAIARILWLNTPPVFQSCMRS